jgi:hypothetical protein
MNPTINDLGFMSGFKIYTDPNLTISEDIQTKYPRSKKKRIKKKFKKMYKKSVIVPSPNIYIFERNMFCHPVYYEKINVLLKNM